MSEAEASGANNAIREVGGVMGVAVLASVFAAQGGYESPQAFTDGVIGALPIAVVVLAAGAVLAVLVLAGGARPRPPPRLRHAGAAVPRRRSKHAGRRRAARRRLLQLVPDDVVQGARLSNDGHQGGEPGEGTPAAVLPCGHRTTLIEHRGEKSASPAPRGRQEGGLRHSVLSRVV